MVKKESRHGDVDVLSWSSVQGTPRKARRG